MATLKDIAKQCGLNVSTVSRALNDSVDIKLETKQKVIKAARELNYFPNNTNSLISNKSTNLIGVIAPEIISGFYSQPLLQIEKMAANEGYTIITGFTNFRHEEEIRLMNMLANKSVEGIINISASPELDKVIEELKTFKQRYEIPVIQIDNVNRLDFYDSLMIDDRLGINIAIKHLRELGHQKIAFIGDKFAISRKYFFTEAMKEQNIDLENVIINIGDERFEEGGYLRMKEILESKNVPTAVLASYDDIAIGAMKAIYQAGMKIPEDISIIGYDDIRDSAYLYDSLTTISVPINDLARIATRILFNKIKNPEYDVIQHVTLNPKLIVRETTSAIN